MLRLSGAAVLAALVLLGTGGQVPAQPPAQPSGQAPGQPLAGSPAPTVLAPLEPGLWELKHVGASAPPARLCLTDLRQLFQPLHPAPLCRQFISENASDHAAVAYDCASRGQGRTTLRAETPRLVQIDSQGIAGGTPFSVRMEARRVGACTSASR